MRDRQLLPASATAYAAVVDLAMGSTRDRLPTFTVEVNGHKLRAIIDSGAQVSAIELTAAARAGIQMRLYFTYLGGGVFRAQTGSGGEPDPPRATP